MKIYSVKIENFRSIENSIIYLNDITAIVGENNAGKTAILRALNSVFNYQFEAKFFINNTHRYCSGKKTKITITFNDVPYREIYKDKINNEHLKIRFEYSYGSHKKSYHCIAGSKDLNIDENFLNELKKDIDFVYIPANRSGDDLKWSDSSILAKVVIAYYQNYTKNRDLLSKRVTDAAKTIHSQVLSKLESELSQLNLVNEYGDYKLSFGNELDYSIFLDQIKLYLEGNEPTMPVSEYGSGVKSLSVIALHRMIAKINNVSIVLGIEEPETNLHPQAQKKLIASLKQKRQECETQTIIATHSTVIIDELEHDDIVLVRRVFDKKRGFHSLASQLPRDFWEKHNITELKHYNFF